MAILEGLREPGYRGKRIASRRLRTFYLRPICWSIAVIRRRAVVGDSQYTNGADLLDSPGGQRWPASPPSFLPNLVDGTGRLPGRQFSRPGGAAPGGGTVLQRGPGSHPADADRRPGARPAGAA